MTATLDARPGRRVIRCGLGDVQDVDFAGSPEALGERRAGRLGAAGLSSLTVTSMPVLPCQAVRNRAATGSATASPVRSRTSVTIAAAAARIVLCCGSRSLGETDTIPAPFPPCDCLKHHATAGWDFAPPLCTIRGGPQARPSVVIVDDHASFRCAARALLDQRGFAVVGEVNGGAAA